MKLLVKTLVGLVLLTGVARAEMPAFTGEILGGLRMNHVNTTSLSSSDKLGFEAGYIARFPVADMVSIRTGGLLVQRDTEATLGSLSVKASRMFLDVPATVAVGNDMVSGYLGADLGLKLSSSCSATGFSSCTFIDEKSFVFQPVLGVELTPMQPWRFGFFYEFETEYSKDWKQSAFGLTASYAL